MSAKKVILTVGMVAMELSMTYAKTGTESISLLTQPPLTTYGGAGGGQALAMAKLGCTIPFCALVGEDDNGENALRYFAQRGVDTRFIQKVKGGHTAVVTSLKKEGEEEILLYGGQTGKMPSSLLEDAFMTLPDGVSLRAELPFETLLLGANLASQKQIPIFLEANSIRRDFRPEELPPLEIFSLSEDAVEQLTGIAIGGVESSVKAALALSSLVRAKYFVFRLGARGCFVYDGKIPQHIAPYRLAAFDFSRSGDGFVAALVSTYLENGGQIRLACAAANAAMALSAAKGQTADTYPSKEDILQLMSK